MKADSATANSPDAAVRPEAFFLPTANGARFCLYYPPQGLPLGDILYVHPFAEEMNKTRRIAAEQARRLSQLGWGVLQIDLAGCGDSEGGFDDASWNSWLADLAAACDWLLVRADGSAGERWIWGLRLGALLAASFAADPSLSGGVRRLTGMLLWQPVVSGSQHLNQFLRLRTVQGLIGQNSTDRAQGETVQTLRADLSAGRKLEVAGYRVAPELALPMAAAELGTLKAIPPRVLWLDVSSQETPSPATTRVLEQWSALRSEGHKAEVCTAVVPGPAFWQTLEIEACPALLDATDALFARNGLAEDRLARAKAALPMA